MKAHPHQDGDDAGHPPPEKRRRVAHVHDEDELFMDDDDDIFLDPHALAILTQADAHAQSAAASSKPPPQPPQPPLPPTTIAAPPTQHIIMSLPPGKQPHSYTGTNGSARAYHVPNAAGGDRIVAHLPPAPHQPPHPLAATEATKNTASAPDDAILRAEIARLEAQLQTRVGEAAMLRQKLATVQADQRKAEMDKREFEERVRAETEAKLATMMQELNKVKSEMMFQEHTIRESQRRVGRIQFSQAAGGAPASPMRSPAVLRTAVSASGLGRMGLMRPPMLPMQPPQIPRFGGSQFPSSLNNGAPAVGSESVVSSEDRMDVDGMDAPIAPPPLPLPQVAEAPQQSSHPRHRAQSPLPAKVDVATSPPSSPSIARKPPRALESPPLRPISYPPHILIHIHTLLQLLPTIQTAPELCSQLLTFLTSPPPTSTTALLSPLAQVLTHITPRLRKDPTEPIVRTALTTALLAHWLARHSSNTSMATSAFDSRLVPAFLDTVCAATTFHFRTKYPAVPPNKATASPSPPSSIPPTWPSDLIPLLFSTLHRLATSSPSPISSAALSLPLPSTLSLLALPSSPYLALAEPEYLAHARDWPVQVHVALAQWCQIVFAHGQPADMLANKPAGRSLVSALVKLAHRAHALHVVREVLRAVHALAARWPALVARRWAAAANAVEAGMGLLVERLHRESHLLVHGHAGHGEEEERAQVVSVGLKVVYMLVVYCTRADAVVRLEHLLAPGGGGASANAEGGGVAGVWTQTRLMATLANVKRWVADGERDKQESAQVVSGMASLKQRVEARRRKTEARRETKQPLFDLEMVAELEAAVGAVVVPGSTQTQQSLTQVTQTQTQTQAL